MLKGIDIAFPDQPDPLAVSSLTAEGVSFVVQKVTQGVYTNDGPAASARIKDVQDAGLIGGAYHVLTRVEDASGDPVPWNSGVAQCNAFVAALPGSSPEGLLCMVEWDADDGGPFTFQDQRFEPVPRGATRQELRDFVRRWFALFPTHPLFLCTRESYAVPRSEGLDIKALNPRLFLWDANRVNGGTPPLGRDIDDAQVAAFEAEVADQGRAAWSRGYCGFAGATIWQFGGLGIAGYDDGRKVNGDIFRGTQARLDSFTVSGLGLGITPLPVGSVETLDDERLSASLSGAAGAHGLTYQIQLAVRPANGKPDWDNVIWSAKGTPSESEALDEDDDPDDESPERPSAPHFEILDGSPAVDGMVVDAQRPTVRLSTDEPVDRYRWKLRQDDEVVESQDHATEGITEGCIEFTPTFKLRRGRPKPATDPAEAEFALPFMEGITYDTRTYSGHSKFAVDFNRKDRQDAGEWAYACAPGRVQFVIHGSREDPVNGPPSELYIGHKGLFQTVYAHLSKLQVRRGDRVEAGQKLGRISNVGSPGGPHLHLQLRRRASRSTGALQGTAMKLRLGGKVLRASEAGSETRDPSLPTIFGQDVRGVGPARPQVRPELRVAARRASDGRWSKYRKLQFFVSKTGHRVPDGVDPGCGGGQDSSGLTIEHLYDGPELAPGNYSLRYRVRDDLGNVSQWARDDSLVVGGTGDDA
jgi:hypothetical protein